MKEISSNDFIVGNRISIEFVEKFLQLMKDLPLERLTGGVEVQGAFNLLVALMTIKPNNYFELGVYKGASSYLVASYFGQKIKLFCFDPRVSFIDKLIPLKQSTIQYTEQDFSTPVFANLVSDQEVNCIFADDHQDVIERLFVAYARGFDYIIFDDDYEGRADHRSFYMLMQQARNNTHLSDILKNIVDFYVTLPDIDVWVKDYPILSPIKNIDLSGHYRRTTVLKLKNKLPKGWTAGSLEWKDNLFNQKIYTAM